MKLFFCLVVFLTSLFSSISSTASEPEGFTKKPFPNGLYESGGPLHGPNFNAVANTRNIEGQDGVLVRVGWNLCGDDIDCLISTIKLNLDTAESFGLKVALAVSDGHNVPQSVKNSCETFDFTFHQISQSMCEVWDDNYLEHKRILVERLADNFDDHPALGYVYFNTACASNGFEGHCRIDRNDYIAAGYTEDNFDDSFTEIMQYYLDSFTHTPIVFEAHTIFNRIGMWEAIWALAADTDQVGIAVWWCSERLSLRGSETLPVWPLVQEIAQATFSDCQTVGQFSLEPYRFTDSSLGFDYGLELDWDQADSLNAFHDTLKWMSGLQTKGSQPENIAAFSVLEAWTQDMKNPLFHEELKMVFEKIFEDQFEN